MSPSFAWSIYNGEAFSYRPILPWLTSLTGENTYMSWAEILDCGDAPLTFLDNTVALKQLEKAHKVSESAYFKSQGLNGPEFVVKHPIGFLLQPMLTRCICMVKDHC